MPAIQLNLGCGHVQPEGWVNVDGSHRAFLASRFSRVDRLLVKLGVLPPTDFNARTVWCNLLKRFPWATGSVDVIYMGEMLEHFTFDQGRFVLGECARVLRPGGVFRLRVPDNARFWRNYLEEYEAMRSRPATQQSREHERWVRMFFREVCVNPRKFGSAGHYHKWMYDEVTLRLSLEEAGFTEVARFPLHQSRIAGVAAVEARDDLIMGAVKPAAGMEVRAAA